VCLSRVCAPGLLSGSLPGYDPYGEKVDSIHWQEERLSKAMAE